MFNIDNIKKEVTEEIFSDENSEAKIEKGWMGELLKRNDKIDTYFVSRENWEKITERGIDNLLSKKKDKDEYVLFLPEDLKRWEMGIIATVIDANTFGEDYSESRERMEKLGEAFKVSAISLSKIMDEPDNDSLKKMRRKILEKDAKKIAEEIIKTYYGFGKAMMNKDEKVDFDVSVDNIKKEDLTKKEQEIADIFFIDGLAAFDKGASPENYNKIINKEKKRLNKKRKREDQAEKDVLTKQEMDELRKTKAKKWLTGLAKEPCKMSEEDRKSKKFPAYKTPKGLVEKMQDNTEKNIRLVTKGQELEMKGAVHRRGAERIKKKMGFDKLLGILDELRVKDSASLTPTDENNIERIENLENIVKFWNSRGYKTLYESLHIEEKKEMLKKHRGFQDDNEIAILEMEYVKRIQKVISDFPYKSFVSAPSNVIEKQYLNCVATTTAQAEFTKELGIKCLSALSGSHIWTFVVLANNDVYWIDPTGAICENKKLSNDDFKKGTIDDILDFLKHPKGKTLKLELKSGFKEYVFGEESKKRKKIISLNDIDEGLRHSILSNIKKDLENDILVKINKEMIDLNSEDFATYFSLGNAFLKNDDNSLDKAIETFQKAIELNPEYADLYNDLGVAFFRNNQQDYAIETLLKAIELKPKDATMLNNLGLALKKNGQIDEAIEVFQKAIKIKPDDFDTYFNLGNAYSKKNKLDEAIETYKKAIKIKPEYADTYFNLGNAYSKKNKLDEAIETYKKAIELNFNGDNLFFNLGVALKKNGQKKEADEMFKKYKELTK